MSWFKLTDDERREWRQHPTTQAFFDAVRDQIADVKDEVVSTMLDEGETAPNHARRMAGRIDGMETVIRVMESDK